METQNNTCFNCGDLLAGTGKFCNCKCADEFEQKAARRAVYLEAAAIALVKRKDIYKTEAAVPGLLRKKAGIVPDTYRGEELHAAYPELALFDSPMELNTDNDMIERQQIRSIALCFCAAMVE